MGKIQNSILYLLIIFILIIYSLTSCAPSQSSIQTAIAKTETAKPTNTFTPIPPTSTFTPIPTNTPTQTEIPRVALRKFLIQISDFGPMSQFYNENPVIFEEEKGSSVLEYCRETFFGKENISGNIIIELYRYQDYSQAKEANEGLKTSATGKIGTITSSNAELPDNFWVGTDLSNSLLASGTRNNIVLFIRIAGITVTTPEELVSFASILAINQVNRLKDGGY